MTANELKALAQDLRNERTEALRKADNAQECLNEVQRKLALLKLQAQCDTPLADYYGG
jgi:exopolyphosphatase/pppGpp-phosphohydrolase